MFQMPVDAWYYWMGLATVSVAVFGIATTLPSGASPDATGLAETVDAVASSEYGGVETRRIDADRLKLGPHRVALRNDAGTAHATFAFGPVTPTVGAGNLSAVLRGDAPSSVFDSSDAFRRAATRARNRTAGWRDAPRRLRVRHVVWRGADVTLVG